MTDYIEGYDSKTCTFNPNEVIRTNFIASCGLGNLKKLILSLYNVLITYIPDEKPQIEFRDEQFACKDENLKLFYGSDMNDGLKSFFTGDENNINEDKKHFRDIIYAWFTVFFYTYNFFSSRFFS